MSERFRKATLAKHLEKGNPPLGVTLAVSRWVDGFYLQLVNEPVRLREIGYLNGNWLFLQPDPFCSRTAMLVADADRHASHY